MKFTFSLFLILAALGTAPTGPNAHMQLKLDAEQAILTVYEGEAAVLSYRFGDQLKTGVDPAYTRSCYIHPLLFLDGQVLTDDFPKDHQHHCGLFWTWPGVKTRGRETQTWHMHLSDLRQYFLRWQKRDITDNRAVIGVENAWKLNGQETVAREIVTITVHPRENDSRIIDFELKLEAVGGPLELQGSPDPNKGYGGFSLRGAPMFKGAVITTDQGRLEGDSDKTAFKWADLSPAAGSPSLGIAVFVPPDHPGAPVFWCIRNSYAGLLNPAWPGFKSALLLPDHPVILRYRIYIHRGDAAAGRVSQAYQQYLTHISQ